MKLCLNPLKKTVDLAIAATPLGSAKGDRTNLQKSDLPLLKLPQGSGANIHTTVDIEH